MCDETLGWLLAGLWPLPPTAADYTPELESELLTEDAVEDWVSGRVDVAHGGDQHEEKPSLMEWRVRKRVVEQ